MAHQAQRGGNARRAPSRWLAVLGLHAILMILGGAAMVGGCVGASSGGNAPGATGGSGDGAGGAANNGAGGGAGHADAGAPSDGQAGGGGAGGRASGGSNGSDAGRAETGDAAGARDGAQDSAQDGAQDSAIDTVRIDAGTAGSSGGARDAAPTPGDAAADTRVDAGATTCTLAGPATARTPIVYVIGDSTASLYTSDLFPRMGWAQPLGDFFTPACATIQDKALSGRSSKSFFDEGAWTPVRDALRAGDYVLIQFGHNDEKSDDLTLFTDPFTTYEQYLSIYINDSLARGATPILLTSINRNKWSNGVLSDTHGNYPVAVRQLAAARQVALVDMTALTSSYFQRIGQAATTLLFMDLAPGQFPNYPAGNVDDTHLQEVGARLIGQMTLADLSRQRLPPGTLARTVPQAP